MTDEQRIGIRMRDRRTSLGISQAKLAALIECSGNQISGWECGQYTPTPDYLVALAKALETTTDYLLGLTDNPSNGKRPRARASS